MQALFDQQAIALMASESEFVKKDSPLTGNIFAQMCIGGTTKKGQLSTLSELCCLALQLGASLCEQSLNERKSVLKLGEGHKMKAHRFLCLLYGQLIWAIINMRIFQALKIHCWNQFKFEISELKGYKIINYFAHQLTKAIYVNNKILYEQCLNGIYLAVHKLGRKQYKKGNPNPLFICKKNLT